MITAKHYNCLVLLSCRVDRGDAFQDAYDYWVSRGFVSDDGKGLNAAGKNFAHYCLSVGGTQQFASRQQLGGDWPKHWKDLETCRKLMQLDLHWSELAYQVTGTPNNRSALRARFDPAFREKHLRQMRESDVRKRAIGKHYTGVKPRKHSTAITLAPVRGLND
jgi:hypothetical protein